MVRRLVTAAVSASAGSLWAALYWSQDARYALGIVLAHVGVGFLMLLAPLVLGRRLRRFSRLEAATVAGLLVGGLWAAPILLFLIDSRYFDVRVSGEGILVATAVVTGATVAGGLAGGSAGRRGPVAAFAALAALAFFPAAASYLLLPPPAGIDIADRLTPAPRYSAPHGAAERAMVLGVDGASWNVLLPMLREGKLPHLRSLMERGRYGVLESVSSRLGDTASPVVWTSIFTGVRPEGHGIRDWFVSDSRNRTRKALWNILNEQGEDAIVVNVPGTFPPEVVRGAMISGFPIPGVVRPSSRRFHAAVGRLYTTGDRALGVVPVTRVELRPATGSSSVESHSPPLELDLTLLENVEAKHGNLRHRASELRVGNLFLELLERRGLFQTRALARYRLLLVDRGDDGTTDYDSAYVYSVADSDDPVAVLERGGWTGWLEARFKGEHFRFQLNWIRSEEDVALYATPLFQSSERPVIPFTYPPDLAARLSADVGQYVVEGAGWLLYEDDLLLDSLFDHVVEVGRQHLSGAKRLLEAVPDWKLFAYVFTESDRIQHPFWSFHAAGERGVDGPHADKVREVMERIDAGIGELLSLAGEDTAVVVVSDHGFRDHPEGHRGEHSFEGVYVIAGKGVAPAHGGLVLDVASFPRASVLDVTPTALFLLGYPVADDFDGRALAEVAESGFEECCPLRRVATYEVGAGRGGELQTIDESTLEQLKSLGYVP